MRPGSQVRTTVTVLEDGTSSRRDDVCATEEPLEIRLRVGTEVRSLVVTMRTPGADFELAAGFLHAEGIGGIRRIEYCTDPGVEQLYNIVTVELDAMPDLAPLERYAPMSSACGICGKTSLDALELRGDAVAPGPTLTTDVLYGLPDALRTAQPVFDRTGGLHASGLFTPDGELVCLREDVGRHNALDKVVGWAVMENKLPLAGHVLVVSGRAGYELLQKALAAGIGFVAAIGAPSSLAVDVAKRFGMTLVGFLRGHRCVIYAGPERVA